MFPPAEENFEKGWRDRVAVEFELVNDAAINSAIKARNGGVRWSAKISAGQVANKTDFAALARQSYASGMARESMGLAKIGPF